MEAKAILKNIHTSPRKARLVVNAIRKRKVIEVLHILPYINKKSAVPVKQLLLSAIANWEVKNQPETLENANLYIKSAQVDAGPMLKRYRYVAKGNVHRIRKRFNHISIVLDSLPVAIARAGEKTTKKKANH